MLKTKSFKDQELKSASDYLEYSEFVLKAALDSTIFSVLEENTNTLGGLEYA